VALLEVLHFPDDRLRNVAKPVETIDEKIRELAANMLETMYAENGIGLAATQVNIAKRIVVIDLSEAKDEAMVLINPEILELHGIESMKEGCLSVPDYFDIVERAESIKYRYQNLDGDIIESETDGLLAVCIQHEIDHLNGKLFIDYLSPLKRQRLKKKIEKLEKQQTVL